MSLESELYARLSGYSGLTALVSSRIYPNVAPQDVAYPYVAWRRVSAERPPGMGSDAGIVAVRIQLDAFATSYLGARAVAEQLRLALQRWRAPAASPEILDSFIVGDLDTFEPDPALHHAVIDASIWTRE